MKTLRVLVVDDSSFMRKAISDILKSDPEIDVIGFAKNGKEALEQVKSLKPDVITLDIHMPEMDGLECLKEMKKIPGFNSNVIILTNLEETTIEPTIKALEIGATDFVSKPTNLLEPLESSKMHAIIEKVKMGKKRMQPKNVKIDNSDFKKTEIPQKQAQQYKTISKLDYIVSIGVSTGGPKALKEVIPLLPESINGGILIVQHMPEGFTKSLAERLNSLSQIEVKEAEDGDIVRNGVAYIAPGNYHMIVEERNRELVIVTNKEDPLKGHRPSIDITMESISKIKYDKVVGIIMTGMGGDGSKGIQKLKNNNNAYIIAQDQKSSIVYGMPKVAVETGVVDEILSLNEISEKITKIVGVHK